MSNVHANKTETTSRRPTVRAGRKNPEPIARPKYRCAACEQTNDCDCLDTARLLDALAPLVRRLVGMVAQESCVIEDDFLDQIALLLDRNDQREREWNAWPDMGDAEDLKCDRLLVEDLVGPWGREAPILRTVEGVAKLRKVPVERVRALLDRFLRESRPSVAPSRFFSCACTADHGKTGCSGAGVMDGLCGWCATNHSPKAPGAKPRRYAGQNFLFEFVDAEVPEAAAATASRRAA